MTSDAIVYQLAAIGHQLWQQRMKSEGWRYAPVYDEAAKTHDALVPFEKLAEHDRRAACLAVQDEGIVATLESVIDYGRGPDREFQLEEMNAGMRVGMAAWAAPSEEPDAAGTVESWDVDLATGLLSVIRVRWDNGELIEHFPAERDLKRLDP